MKINQFWKTTYFFYIKWKYIFIVNVLYVNSIQRSSGYSQLCLSIGYEILQSYNSWDKIEWPYSIYYTGMRNVKKNKIQGGIKWTAIETL